MTLPIQQHHAPAAPAPDRPLPTLSIVEAETFWADGQDACAVPCAQVETFLKTPGHTCCVGVDMPERGHVHSHDCPARSRMAAVEFTDSRCSLCGARRLSSGVCSLVPGRDGTGGCPDPLHDLRAEERDRFDQLMCRLVLQSHGLAQSRISRHMVTNRVSCTECLRDDVKGVILHAPTCRAGRVLRILADLSEVETRKTIRKEAVADGEAAPAGGGIRPPSAPQHGEPWQFLVDYVLMEIRVYDRDGALLIKFDGVSEDVVDRANHIVASVNWMAANSSLLLAVRP